VTFARLELPLRARFAFQAKVGRTAFAEPALGFACSALSLFTPLFQWVFLYLAHIRAL
jgi:hypothetical protein